MKQTPSENLQPHCSTGSSDLFPKHLATIKMNCRSSAIGKAAIVALLLVMVGLSCKGAPVKRSSTDRNIILQISKYFLTMGYNALEVCKREAYNYSSVW